MSIVKNMRSDADKFEILRDELVLNDASASESAAQVSTSVKGCTSGQLCPASIRRVNRHHIRAHQSFSESIYHAYHAGRAVLAAQKKAPRKGKTQAVEKMANHPRCQVSIAQLHRYLRIAKNLPKELGLSPEYLSSMTKNAFRELAPQLTQSALLKLLRDERQSSNDVVTVTTTTTLDVDAIGTLPSVPDSLPLDDASTGSEPAEAPTTLPSTSEPSVDQGTPAHINATHCDTSSRASAEAMDTSEVAAGVSDGATFVEPDAQDCASQTRNGEAPVQPAAAAPVAHVSASIHIFCEDRDLPNVIRELARRDYHYDCTHVVCVQGEPLRHAFVVNGIRSGAESPLVFLGTWFIAGTAAVAVQEAEDRIRAAAPWGEFLVFNSVSESAN